MSIVYSLMEYCGVKHAYVIQDRVQSLNCADTFPKTVSKESNGWLKYCKTAYEINRLMGA
jgi:hypothetical protein